MRASDPDRRITVAVGRRFDTRFLLDGVVKAHGLDVEYPDVPRVPTTGAPMPMFSILAREHPWDVGELAFSSYLLARDLGKPWIALPVFPSRFFPHTGMWVRREAGMTHPADWAGQRVACGSFATNYSVWCRGALSHQYDVPIQGITWVESAEEHVPEFRPPKRFAVERLAGEAEPVTVLLAGGTEAATLPGPARGADLDRIRPLFEDPYREIAGFAEAFGFFPINTVLTVRRDAVERNPDMPSIMLDTFRRARALYDAEIAQGKEDVHMGLSLRRLKESAGLTLPGYGFQENRPCIQHMIAYSYEQGVIRKLVDPEDLFLLPDS